MSELFQSRMAAAAAGRLAGSGRTPALLEHYDTLDCMYCSQPVAPSEVRQDQSVVYRCTCRKAFHVVADGTVCRGMSGRPF